MKTTAREFVLFLVVLLVVQNVSGWLGTNVTRVEKNDKFTNPNRTAVGDCRASGQSSLLDTCKTFASTNTRAVCSSFSSCCESCQCGSAYSTYLPHLRKCVNLAELTSDVFGQGSSDCGPRLEKKGKGGGDDDDDRDDDDDDHKHKDPCKAKSWTPPVIDFQSSSKYKIKFCKAKGVESCSFERARYSGSLQWTNITNLKQMFWGRKDKKDILLQWNKAAASQVTGNVIVINLLCKQKKGKHRLDFSACFMFKSAGTQIVTPPPQTTTTTKPTTTSQPTTTTARPTAKAITTSQPTTTTARPTTKTTTTKPTTTAYPTTTSKPKTAKTTTTQPKTTANPSTSKPTKIPTTPSRPDIQSTTTQKALETTSSPATQATSDVTPTQPIEPTEPTEPTEPVEPVEPTEPTEPVEPHGADKLSDKSSDGRGSGTTVIVVAVLCTLLAVSALCAVTIYYLKRRKRRKGIVAMNESSIQIKKPSTAQDKPDDHVYQGQSDVYQLLERDGKATGGGQWEPPAYQGLTKGAPERAWGEGEVYTNPSMYQDLTKNGTTCNENLPAYHPLAKQNQSKAEDAPVYECGYMALTGEHGKMQETADKENPYYFKVQQDENMVETADKENPYYFKLDQHDKMEETADTENYYYSKVEQAIQ